MFKIHLNNFTILGKPVESSKQDILQEGSLTKATMTSGHSPGISSNGITKEAPEPSRGPAYIPSNFHNIPSSHTVIPTLYQNWDAHHVSKAKKIHDQGEEIMGEEEKLEMACYPEIDFGELCLYLGLYLPNSVKVLKFKKYDGGGCPHTHLWRCCNDMFQLGDDERVLIHLFSSSLKGQALRWLINLDKSKLQTWIGLSRAF